MDRTAREGLLGAGGEGNVGGSFLSGVSGGTEAASSVGVSDVSRRKRRGAEAHKTLIGISSMTGEPSTTCLRC